MSFPKANLRCWCRCAHSIFTLSIMFTAKLFLHSTKESPRFPFGPYHFSLEPNTNVFSPTHKVFRGVFCAINISHRRIKREAFLQLFSQKFAEKSRESTRTRDTSKLCPQLSPKREIKIPSGKKLVRKGNSEKWKPLLHKTTDFLHAPLLIFCGEKLCIAHFIFGSFSGLPSWGSSISSQAIPPPAEKRKKGQCDSNMCLPIEDSDERMESQELSFFRHQSPPEGLLLLQTRQKDSPRKRPLF